MFGRRLRGAVGALALVLVAAACSPTPTGPANLEPWTGYPIIQQPVVNSNWLVLKCRLLADGFAPPDLGPYVGSSKFTDLNDVVNKFLGGANGTGNVLDYYRDVTYGGLRLTTDIRGWYDAPFRQSDIDSNVDGLRSRGRRISKCAEQIPASAGVDLSAYDGVVMVTEALSDSGADGACPFVGLTVGGTNYPRIKGCVALDSLGLNINVGAHEMGHGLGLPHSFWDTPTAACAAEYCDAYDIMGGLPRLAKFTGKNYPGGEPKSDGPGMNVPNLLKLGVLPDARIATYDSTPAGKIFVLAALSHPEAGATGTLPLAIRFTSAAGKTYTIEYRQNDGWDQGMAESGVIIHALGDSPRFAGSPYSTALVGGTDAAAGLRAAGNVYLIGNADGTPGVEQFKVEVLSIDTTIGAAVVKVSSQ